MEVQPERGGARCHTMHEWWAIWRIKRTWRFILTRVDRTDRKQIGPIQGVEERPTHIFNSVTWQAAKKSVQRVNAFHSRGEPEVINGFLDLTAGRLYPQPVLIHQNHYAGVITHADLTAAYFRNGGIGVRHHINRILVYFGGRQMEHLRPEADLFLLPFSSEFVQRR